MKRKSKYPKVDERHVVRAVLLAVDWPSDGIRLVRQNTGAFTVRRKGYDDSFVRFGRPGQSDITGIVSKVVCPVCRRCTGQGVRLEIECKSRYGTVRKNQERWMREINEANGIAFVVRPEPCDEDPTGLNHKQLRRRILEQIHTVCSDCKEMKNQ